MAKDFEVERGVFLNRYFLGMVFFGRCCCDVFYFWWSGF